MKKGQYVKVIDTLSYYYMSYGIILCEQIKDFFRIKFKNKENYVIFHIDQLSSDIKFGDMGDDDYQ